MHLRFFVASSVPASAVTAAPAPVSVAASVVASAAWVVGANGGSALGVTSVFVLPALSGLRGRVGDVAGVPTGHQK